MALLDSEPDVLRYLARNSSRPYRVWPAFMIPSQVAASWPRLMSGIFSRSRSTIRVSNRSVWLQVTVFFRNPL